jgi:transcriptional regulator with XRE-family HTH domain
MSTPKIAKTQLFFISCVFVLRSDNVCGTIFLQGGEVYMKENKRIANTSDRLKEAMLLAEKTQADLVRDTGLSKSTLSRYLSGEFEPKQNAIGKLASSLNVNEMWLWGYDVPKVKKEPATENGNGLSESKRQLLALAEQCSEEDAAKLLQMLQIFLGKQ